MATNKTPLVLGDIEHSQIKTSLTEYLKTQSIFSGYNFEGSAIQTLIDLLAYNSFYYAYYANMINAEAFLDSAQREESIISLTKPLGYTVPARTAAKAKIEVSGILNENTIPVGTIFAASDANGVQFNFYVLDEQPVVGGVTEPFYVYEGTQFINKLDVLSTLNYDLQRIVVADTNFDISTLRVYVTELQGDVEITNEWTKVQNIGYSSQLNENIYFVERTSTGFMIHFSVGNQIGRVIDQNITKIEISYLKTSGGAGNDFLNFRNTSLSGNVNARTIEQSFGGLSRPDLDRVRSVAPKWFAAQERAVTVNDYKALLLESEFFQDERDFNVFGGQDLNPPRYGRVFVTSNLNLNNERIVELVEFLKERSVVTVLPEYVQSRTLNVYTDFSFRAPNTSIPSDINYILSTIKSIFRNKYSVYGRFNVSFSASTFVNDITTNPSYDQRIREIIISPDDFTNYVQETIGPNQTHVFNLQNELYLPVNTRINITDLFVINQNIKDDFNIPATSLGRIKMYVTFLLQKNSPVNLELWAVQPDGTETRIPFDTVGYFKANSGVVVINDGVLGGETEFKVDFAKKNFTIGLSNLVTFDYNKVELYNA